MNGLYVAAVVLAAGLLGYLLFALLCRSRSHDGQ
jgi:hypothetical protein